MSEERELGAWIAEKLFRWTEVSIREERNPHYGHVAGKHPELGYAGLPNYLTDANEWERVEDKLIELGFDPSMDRADSNFTYWIIQDVNNKIVGKGSCKSRRESRFKALTQAKPHIEKLLENENANK